ncbi:MAG: HemK2/MTQ2 family protein methyltransferase [archaeon]
MTRTVLHSAGLQIFETVYDPSDDSILLAESVEIMPDSEVLDMGCGSGIQSINAAQLGAKKVLAVDVNKAAVKNTAINAKKFGMEKKISARQSNLFEDVNQKFDTVIFNPPYVESEKKELLDVDGGKKGREVLDRFLGEFPKFLKPGGKCFFLQSSLNGKKKTQNKLLEKGFEFEIVGQKKLFFEELVVFCCWKKI